MLRNRILSALLTLPILALQGCTDAPTAVTSDANAFSSAAAASPLQLQFDKCLTDPAGVWNGTVAGDVSGDLETVLRDLWVAGPVWHVRFDWIVDAGNQSFVADLSGLLNTNTGRVVMDGQVSEGYLLGAQVHEEGHADADRPGCFTGTIQIMPATAR
jgi:hypothetical protein